MKYIGLLIKLLVSLGFTGAIVCMDRPEPKPQLKPSQVVNLFFINATGHDLKVQALYFDTTKLQPAPKVVSKTKNSVQEAEELKEQNLAIIEKYVITFANPSFLESISLGVLGRSKKQLEIDAVKLGQKMAQKEETEAIISIFPSKYLGYVTGFQDYKVTFKPKLSTGSSQMVSQPFLEGSFLLVPEQSKEQELLLKELGLSAHATAYEIFGLSAKTEVGKNKNIGAYLKTLEEKKAALLQQFKDNPVLDVQQLKKLKIKNYTKKMRDMIVMAYKQILNDLGVE